MGSYSRPWILHQGNFCGPCREYTFADIKVVGWLGWLLGDKEGFAHWPCVILGISSLVVGGTGIAYGRRQKALRERAVEHIHPRVKSLEGHIDPARTSSGLDIRGNTPQEEG